MTTSFATHSNIANKFTGKLQYYGRATIEPDEELVIEFDGLPGSLQVFIQGTNVADYMLASTNDSIARVEAESAEYIDSYASDLDTDLDLKISAYTTAIKITNKATSTDDLVVVWRL